MKKFNKNWILLTMIATLSMVMVACGDGSDEDITPLPGGSEDNQTPQPSQGQEEGEKFPEFTTLSGTAGDTLNLSFNATTNWQLTTNSLWCKLGDGLYDISGAKGSQDIAIIITDANLGFTIDSTDITMKVDNESKVIARVYRQANSYTISVTEYGVIDEEVVKYDENNPIEIDHYGTISLEIEANFEWIPACEIEWVNISINDNILTLDVLDEFTQNPIMNEEDLITFSNGNEVLLSINVSYIGMNPNEVIIEPSTKWNLQISTDGTTYYETSLSDEEAIAKPAPYTAKLTALNDAYTILSYNLDATTGMTLMENSSAWFTVTDDKVGNITVSFSANEEAERSGYLLAIPNGHYETIKDDLQGSICDNNENYLDLKPEYEKYVIAHFVQQAMISSEFAEVSASYLTGSMKSIPTEMLTSLNTKGDIFGYATSTFNVTSVAYLAPTINTSFQIMPSVEEWAENEVANEDGSYPPIVEVFIDNGTSDESINFGIEGWQNNGKMALMLRVPTSAEGSIVYVVFKKNGENKQVAVLDMRN